MSSNELVGSLPAEVGLMKKLTTIAIDNNKLSGQLPETVKKLRSLRMLCARTRMPHCAAV